MSTLACGVINAAYSQGIISTINTLNDIRTAEVTKIITNPANPADDPVVSGDPGVLGYAYNGDNCAMVVSYNYDAAYNVDLDTTLIALFKIDAGTGAWVQLVQKSAKAWGFSNPYGLVVIENKMYVQDYDSGRITVIDLTSYLPSTLYTMPDVTVGATTYKAHGNGMEYSSEYGLVAIYSFLPAGNTTNYYPSKVAIVATDGSTSAVVAGLNNNVVSVAVDPENQRYAYICSIGGAQQGDGNPSSKIQTVDLDAEQVLTTEITVSDLPATGSSENKKGSFVDVAFWNSSAYVLRADYNTGYTQYSYQIIQTSGDRLRAGNFGAAGSDYTQTGIFQIAPADATWLLGPSADALWFVNGSAVNIISSGNLDDTSVVPKATATTLGSAPINAHLNNASVVIDIAAARLRDATVLAAVPTATRTKVGYRFVQPAQREDLSAVEAAAAKQE